MSDRKAELEKKRKKLEELRKARDQKKKETSDKEVRVVGTADEGISRAQYKNSKQSGFGFHNYINSLLKSLEVRITGNTLNTSSLYYSRSWCQTYQHSQHHNQTVNSGWSRFAMDCPSI